MSFIYQRNRSASYQNSPRFKGFATKEKEVPMKRRVFLWLSTAILLGGLYILPLHLHLNQIAQGISYNLEQETFFSTSASSKVLSVFSMVASAVSLLALGVQTLADKQKMDHKEMIYKNAPSGVDETALDLPPNRLPFCTTGLYKTWRHPNYVAEFVFHVGIFFAAVPTFTSWHSVLLAFVGPAVFGSIIRGATTMLEKRQAEAYTGKFGGAYDKWVASSKRWL